MPYCPDCGVEIGDAPQCPLCGAQNPRAGVQSKPEKSCTETDSEKPSGLRESGEEFSGPEKRTIAWEVLSVAFCIAIFVLAAVNLFRSGHFSWSLYPIASILLSWVEATIWLVSPKMTLLRVLLSIFALFLFLVALGFVSKNPRWALGLAVPIAILVASLTGAVFLAIHKSRQRGLNLVAYVLVALAALCMGLEVFIDLFAQGVVVFDWAPICAISLLPVAAFLLYLHYRVIKGANLRRLFHL